MLKLFNSCLFLIFLACIGFLKSYFLFFPFLFFTYCVLILMFNFLFFTL
ncbi:hypothetical protein HMPREF1408_00015 [Helicobacter pylori GAM245Ai]|nr:hypothetical protein HMPREF1408_00015 [Helicobacter pylori GAM245Ai]